MISGDLVMDLLALCVECIYIYIILDLFMDWEAAKKHCKERKWDWSLNFILEAQEEVMQLEEKLKKLEAQQRAQRLYSSCNF